MEKMQLGSPASPGQNVNFLPNFLMGVESNQTPNRISFSNSPTASPDNFNKSNQQKFFTGMQSPQTFSNSINQQQQVYQNASITGPPTTGLFDYLKNDKSFQTPTRNFSTHQQSQSFQNVSQQQQSFHNQSQVFSPNYNQSQGFSPSFNQSSVFSPGPAFNQSGFNQSRIMSPIISNTQSNADFENSRQYQPSTTFSSTVPTSGSPVNGYNNSSFWITVFGFPQSVVSEILGHFSQCGAIIEKVYSSGNWIHLKFSSKLECDKALLYNGKIIYNNLMVGVLRCTDESVIDKENAGNQRVVNRGVRSLTQAAYKSAQEPTEVVLSPNAPKRTTGIINKTLDMFFGW